MAYVSWPNVASTHYVESMIPKIKLMQLTVSSIISENTPYTSPLIDTSFLTSTGTGYVSIEVDAAYVHSGTIESEIRVTILDSTGQNELYKKSQLVSGAGSRSGIMLPLMCIVTQQSIASGFKIRLTNVPDTSEPTNHILVESKIQVKITQSF